MTNEENQLINNYCDQRTSTGKEVSVTWNGGGDEGLVEIILDDDIIERDVSIESLIEECVLEYLGYGRFAGTYNASGSVSYNRDEKCFEGTDTYSESKSGTVKFEAVEVLIPETIWFDRLRVRIDSDSDSESRVSVEFMMDNGPHTDIHKEFEEKIKSAIEGQVEFEIQKIDALDQIKYDQTNERNELDIVQDSLLFSIKEFDYWYESSEDTDVNISLTQQIEEYENI